MWTSAQSVKNADGDYIRPFQPSTAHEQVPPLKPVEYVIELAPTSNVWRAGHRIRLDIQPIADGYLDSARSAGVGALTIHRGGLQPSRLVVAVIPSRCQLGELASTAVSKPSCGSDIRFAGEPPPRAGARPGRSRDRDGRAASVERGGGAPLLRLDRSHSAATS